MTDKKIRVLIIDDSAVVRGLFVDMLSDVLDIEVVGTAIDPYDARQKIKELQPDVLTLDIEMPRMDGLTFLEKIMSLRPMPVIMVSTLTLKGADETLRALSLGAIDFISKPKGRQKGDTLDWLKDELVEKIRIAAQTNIRQRGFSLATASPAKPLRYDATVASKISVIALGASTGGVEAFSSVFAKLPANLPPIVIAQHMPSQFTPSFAKRLNALSAVTVLEAPTGMHAKPGHAYLAPGDKHLRVGKQGGSIVLRLDDGEKVSGHRPSVDALFDSVAESFGRAAIGAIMTGMGQDGAQGLKHMRDAGAHTIAQSQESCIVFGMPKAAIACGAAVETASLEAIPEAIIERLGTTI